MNSVEQIVADGLDAAGVEYIGEAHPSNAARLDFYLPASDVYIEVKSFHSERIAGQMARAQNVIAIQGETAARLFAEMLKGEGKA